MNREHQPTACADTLSTEASSAPAEAIEWSFDAQLSAIQGPLELEFFHHRRLVLNLKTDQAAVLTNEGHLESVFGGGRHQLQIGNGPGEISPDLRLAFLDLGRDFQFSWSRMNPVSWGPNQGRSLIGNCALRIGAPEPFYDTFMAGCKDWEPIFLQRLMEQTVRGSLESILSANEFEPGEVSFSELQAQITRLEPRDLSENLEPCGLVCVNLAVYTAAPPVEHQDRIGWQPETAGQFPGVGHN